MDNILAGLIVLAVIAIAVVVLSRKRSGSGGSRPGSNDNQLPK